MKRERLTAKDILKIVEDTIIKEDDIEEYMEEYYNDLLFLGTSIISDKELLSVVKHSIRVCITFFKMTNDKMKIQELKKLSKCLKTKKIRIVDKAVIDQILIFQN